MLAGGGGHRFPCAQARARNGAMAGGGRNFDFLSSLNEIFWFCWSSGSICLNLRFCGPVPAPCATCAGLKGPGFGPNFTIEYGRNGHAGTSSVPVANRICPHTPRPWPIDPPHGRGRGVQWGPRGVGGAARGCQLASPGTPPPRPIVSDTLWLPGRF